MVTSAAAVMANRLGTAKRHIVGTIGAVVRACCNAANFLAVCEVGWALVQESVHALFLVVCGKQSVEQTALKHHAIG